jgi:hypothetical protein
VTRNKEIRQRRTRRKKRRRQLQKKLRQAVAKGRTRADRVRLAQEFRESLARAAS